MAVKRVSRVRARDCVEKCSLIFSPKLANCWFSFFPVCLLKFFFALIEHIERRQWLKRLKVDG